MAADGYVKEERQERPKTAILSLAKKWRPRFPKTAESRVEFKPWASLAVLLAAGGRGEHTGDGYMPCAHTLMPASDMMTFVLKSHISHLAYIHRRQATSEVNTLPTTSPRWK